jgi:S-adenosylmethionine:tRNA ribosyltransferase-isomerase
MELHRDTGEIRHHRFSDLIALLCDSDLLVLNETRVIPAALSGRKSTGGKVELLVLNPAGSIVPAQTDKPARRECMVNAGKAIREGMRIALDTGPELVVEEARPLGRGLFRFPVPESGILEFLNAHGAPPLPPYIKPQGRRINRDRNRYQTVYGKVPGSVAAPTAGLHFTDSLLEKLTARGLCIERILLHVGPGTFMPVREEDVRGHKMESEWYEIPPETARSVNLAQETGKRIIAVGTTTVRALEACATPEGFVQAGKGRTDLFILPGHAFRVVRGMITNFHLPGSTLLMLVCALAGTESVLKAYREAVQAHYRFYSYGDACLIIDNH